MAILTKDDVLKRLKEKIGEDTSDETLKLIEDVSDTLDDLEKKTKDSTDWEKKYKDNDEAWRKKYKERFFSAPSMKDEDKNPPPDEDDDFDEKPKILTYENLFKEETK